jgi:hypothetical protein
MTKPNTASAFRGYENAPKPSEQVYTSTSGVLGAAEDSTLLGSYTVVNIERRLKDGNAFVLRVSQN